ncbi:unnamed protein product [Heligmosomoides polygyrus]|uniref:Phlebovirus glycoprotein G2 fusion domain-containing protein n=1 Tax=Heligmosomoides polygyrus TaxID=6339 RepID=A0A3P8FH45_HELPZ|nr:unnamed protein product [Heligmosomoides polygyrus]
MLQNTNLVHVIRLQWKSLRLLYAVHKVIHSKTSSHSGYCADDKCAANNNTSLVPELEKGNHYPDNTSLESCGGPGCDCFT